MVALGLTDQMVNAESLWETRMTYIHMDEINYLHIEIREAMQMYIEASTNRWIFLFVDGGSAAYR